MPISTETLKVAAELVAAELGGPPRSADVDAVALTTANLELLLELRRREDEAALQAAHEAHVANLRANAAASLRARP